MKSLYGGANASISKKSSRKSRSRARSLNSSLKKKNKKTLAKSKFGRTRSLRKKKNKGVKFTNKNRKLLYGELNNGTGKYSEWRQNINHGPLKNCIPVNDTAVSLPAMYNIYTKKKGIGAQYTDNIGTVNTCLPDEYPFLGKSDDNRWCCFRTLEEAKKNDHLASNVKKNLKQQQHNIHQEFAKSLPAGSNLGKVFWSKENKKISQKEKYRNQTGPHLLCNPRDSGRMRNINKCSTDMYPCYDPKDDNCYNIDGDVYTIPSAKMSTVGNTLRPQLKKLRSKPKSSITPKF